MRGRVSLGGASMPGWYTRVGVRGDLPPRDARARADPWPDGDRRTERTRHAVAAEEVRAGHLGKACSVAEENVRVVRVRAGAWGTDDQVVHAVCVDVARVREA